MDDKFNQNMKNDEPESENGSLKVQKTKLMKVRISEKMPLICGQCKAPITTKNKFLKCKSCGKDFCEQCESKIIKEQNYFDGFETRKISIDFPLCKECYNKTLIEQKELITMHRRFLQLRETLPPDPEVWITTAERFKDSGIFDLARLCFNEAINIDEKIFERIVKSWEKTGYKYLDEARNEEALRCFSEVLILDPKKEIIWQNQGKILLEQNQLEKAIESFDKVININKDNVEAWCGKGLALSKLNDPKASRKCFIKAINIDPGKEVIWLYKLQSHRLFNEFRELIECTNRALKINPKNEETWLYKWEGLMKLNELSQALDCCDQILKINSSNPKGWECKGNTLFQLGEYEEALKNFDNALNYDPEGKQINIQAILENIQKAQGDLKKSIPIPKWMKSGGSIIYNYADYHKKVEPSVLEVEIVRKSPENITIVERSPKGETQSIKIDVDANDQVNGNIIRRYWVGIECKEGDLIKDIDGREFKMAGIDQIGTPFGPLKCCRFEYNEEKGNDVIKIKSWFDSHSGLLIKKVFNQRSGDIPPEHWEIKVNNSDISIFQTKPFPRKITEEVERIDRVDTEIEADKVSRIKEGPTTLSREDRKAIVELEREKELVDKNKEALEKEKQALEKDKQAIAKEKQDILKERESIQEKEGEYEEKKRKLKLSWRKIKKEKMILEKEKKKFEGEQKKTLVEAEKKLKEEEEKRKTEEAARHEFEEEKQKFIKDRKAELRKFDEEKKKLEEIQEKFGEECRELETMKLNLENEAKKELDEARGRLEAEWEKVQIDKQKMDEERERFDEEQKIFEKEQAVFEEAKRKFEEEQKKLEEREVQLAEKEEKLLVEKKPIPVQVEAEEALEVAEITDEGEPEESVEKKEIVPEEEKEKKPKKKKIVVVTKKKKKKQSEEMEPVAEPEKEEEPIPEEISSNEQLNQLYKRLTNGEDLSEKERYEIMLMIQEHINVLKKSLIDLKNAGKDISELRADYVKARYKVKDANYLEALKLVVKVYNNIGGPEEGSLEDEIKALSKKIEESSNLFPTSSAKGALSKAQKELANNNQESAKALILECQKLLGESESHYSNSKGIIAEVEQNIQNTRDSGINPEEAIMIFNKMKEAFDANRYFELPDLKDECLMAIEKSRDTYKKNLDKLQEVQELVERLVEQGIKLDNYKLQLKKAKSMIMSSENTEAKELIEKIKEQANDQAEKYNQLSELITTMDEQLKDAIDQDIKIDTAAEKLQTSKDALANGDYDGVLQNIDECKSALEQARTLKMKEKEEKEEPEAIPDEPKEEIIEEPKPVKDMESVNWGENYLLMDSSPVLAYTVQRMLSEQNVSSLTVSNLLPKELYNKYQFKPDKLIWLTEKKHKGAVPPTKLSKLKNKVNKFISSSEMSIVLFDNVEILVDKNKFEKVLEFFKEINNNIKEKQSVLILILNTKAYSEEELNLLKEIGKNLKKIDFKSIPKLI